MAFCKGGLISEFILRFLLKLQIVIFFVHETEIWGVECDEFWTVDFKMKNQNWEMYLDFKSRHTTLFDEQ